MSDVLFVEKNDETFWCNDGVTYKNDEYITITYNKKDYKKKRFLHGQQLHSQNDLPAIEYANGTKEWYQHGELHRENDLPAVEFANGDKIWYQRGVRKRENYLPSIEYIKGIRGWYKNGVYLPSEFKNVKLEKELNVN